MRRGSIVQLLLISAVVAGIATAVALIPNWLPRSASEQADRIDFVFWFVTAICIAIFAVVVAVILYSLWKFRASPDDDSDGPPVHGHTGLEIGWTAVPTVLVIAIAVVSAIVLARNDRAGSAPLRVNVTAQQFVWNFSYPESNDMSSATLRLPVGRPVKLSFKAIDVLHSFWVPEFGQKQDTVPGITTTLVITPKRVGSFPVICTELCGIGHAIMRAEAVVMKPAAFDAWARGQKKALSGDSRQAGSAVFEAQGCGSCHTLAAARATGKVGPSLDKLPAEAKQAGKPLEDFVRESIVNPDAYVQPGYSKELMPETYDELPKEQLGALVEYLIDSSRKGTR